jgi:Uncharacterized conserved protein
LRQRLEGTRWIQTLKAAGKSHIERFEHNLDLGEVEQAPALDLSVYANEAEVQSVLKTTLGDQQNSLQLQFETDILRTYRVIEFEDARSKLA